MVHEGPQTDPNLIAGAVYKGVLVGTLMVIAHRLHTLTTNYNESLSSFTLPTNHLHHVSMVRSTRSLFSPISTLRNENAGVETIVARAGNTLMSSMHEEERQLITFKQHLQRLLLQGRLL